MRPTKPTLPATQARWQPRARSAGPDEAQTHRHIQDLEAEVSALRGQVRAMKGSLSWRISAPVRWIGSLVRRIRHGAPAASVKRSESYSEWVRLYDTPTDGKRGAIVPTQHGGLAAPPTLSILMLGRTGQAGALVDSIRSVQAQDFSNWEIIALVDPLESHALESLPGSDERGAAGIVIRELSSGQSASAALNAALASARGDWLLLLAPGSLLPTYALRHIAAEILAHGEARLIYSDDDELDAEGQRMGPRFKPDWNPELFQSQDYLDGMVVIAKDLVRELAGFREGFEDALEYDLILRCSERLRPAQIHHIPRVLRHATARSGGTPPHRKAAELRALVEYLGRCGAQARVDDAADGRRVRYALPAEPPPVTLIVPTRNALALLRQCLESIVLATNYPDFDILVVDNGSDDPATLAYLKGLDGQQGIRVLRDDHPFNYSALNNMAVRQARGQVVGLINNDVEVIAPGWLEEMVALALQPGVGAVGAKLLYPDETVQHGGVILGIGGESGIAGHAHKFLPAWQAGYMGRAKAVQTVSAVTAACLVVRKALYEKVGGLNEVELKVAYSDVDFCLKLRDAGYRNVWTPFAELFHHESATRGADVSGVKLDRLAGERAYMQRQWGALIAADPAYNPNLTVHAEDFGLAWPPRVPWIQGAAR